MLPQLNKNKPHGFVSSYKLSHIDFTAWLDIITWKNNFAVCYLAKGIIDNIFTGCGCALGMTTVFTTIVETSRSTMQQTSELNTLIQELERQLSQLDNYIQMFNNFEMNNAFNVVFEDGQIGIDTGTEVSDTVAQTWTERVNVFNNVIHARCHSIEDMLNDIFDIESSIDDTDYEFRFSYFLEKYLNVTSRYRHF
uniref:Uncharacterized protein n=1 Tax=Opegrapha vulgata TaxID=543791 RepID=A0A286QSI6_9PEZI|nr:hypothetical protein [Opegrapha vulgata]ASB29430.1 hypothetical protein [Opegrapha vulgata]